MQLAFALPALSGLAELCNYDDFEAIADMVALQSQLRLRHGLTTAESLR